MVAWGIDLGTANTVVYHPDEGLLHDQPSAAISRTTRRGGPVLVALGHDAAELDGRTDGAGGAMSVERPIRGGVVADLDAAHRYLRAVLAHVTPGRWRRWIRRPAGVLGVPLGATSLERRALAEVAQEAGLRRPVVVGEAVGAALGCGIDPMDRRVHLVADIGGGTAEVAALCFGGVVAHRSCREAGDAMTAAVRRLLRERYGLVVGERAAERAKIEAGAHPDGAAVGGRDAASGRPRVVVLGPGDLADAVRPVVGAIVATLASCLDDLPTSGVGDVLAEGVLLVGGGSLTPGVADDLEDALGFPVKRADSPLTCVAEGLAAAARRPDVLAAHGV